ncbi:cation transporter [Lactobacillus jensenii]|uniref:SLC13 family permease n=1 Tax=Lactobacillus jensenii TaxID=109790 RepID=UPI001196279E|nr:SLC13 family permease [Lactobacillus jensenii]MCW8081469.1 SLC13 family permease [Lactobacillus jensenii]MCW8089334.1 SLC13 family permease [Lactobacillus jensenii]MCZ9641820.1 cation transporter [Lactobacillus jensenii]MCZ9656849.1 cation transporter [Lactobacillus jensenii]MCZ9659820.1 cation transporter [Lactobacillus jensenii]
MTVLKNIFKDRIFQISLVITIISLFFARPRISDINFHTLYSVTAMLCLIQIYAYLHVLDILAYKLTSLADNTRKLTLLFTLLSVLSGMFLGNDITVLTLIPLYLNVAKKYQLPQIYPTTLIGMGANIGAAFTPWGNPHNIFIVSNYNVPANVFFAWSTPYLIVSLVILIATCFFLPKDHIPVNQTENIHVNWRMTILTTAVFIFFFFGVFSIVPIYYPMIAALLLALLINPRIYLKIDYALLLTFTLFFIFISDIQQIPLIVGLIHMTVYSEGSTYLTSIISSQFISNVPSTILVGKFINFAKALLLGSNIGGFGSVVGSMANMLVLKTFNQHSSASKRKFFKHWTILQFSGLIILTIVGWLIIYFNI